MRELLKRVARGIALVAAAPAIVSFHLRTPIMGSDRALEGSTQVLAILPGIMGQYIRRAFLGVALAHVAPSATISFGTIFSRVGTRIDDCVYIGPGCHIGLVHLERDVLIGAGVHLPSGPATHGTADSSVPIREQSGSQRRVRVGRGAWIGSASVVMADVGSDTVVGAGSVVTRALPASVVAAGVPARTLRSRVDRTAV